LLGGEPFAGTVFNDNQKPLEFIYVTDMEGRLVACEIESWLTFALGHGAPELAGGVGLNVFASCSDAATASAYRVIHALLQLRKLDQYSFNYRCDSPERARLFRMTMTLHPARSTGAVLYRSQLLGEKERPPVALLGQEARTRPAPSARVSLCSFCQRAWDPVSASWLEAEQHPAAKDATAGTMHGVCRDCDDQIIAPLAALSAAKEQTLARD
jgi:hypothetical protein